MNAPFDRLRSFFVAAGRRPVQWVLFLCALIALSVLYRHAWRGDNIRHRIGSDGAGYYSYLPAVFIYQDLSFDYYKEIERKYHNRDGFAYFLNYTDGMMVNKYFVGESLLLMPFFFLAWLLSLVFGTDPDGYSFFFQCSVGVAAVTYSITGLWLLSRVLVRHVSERSVAIAIAAVYLGTNLFFYTVFEASHAHAYSFALICAWIWAADRSLRSRSRGSYWLLALITAWIAVTRPTNVVVVLSLPFIAGTWKAFMPWLAGVFRPVVLVPGMAIAGIFIGIQSLTYFLQEGKWWIQAYGDEGFHFLEPRFHQVLFSFRAGLFVWAPVLLLAIPGSVVAWKRYGPATGWLFLWFVVNTWIISSWYVWHYEGTFGMRPFTDHLGFFVWMVALAVDATGRRKVWLPALFIVACIGLQQAQTWQRFKVIIHWGKMDADKYAYLFLKMDSKYAFLFGDAPDDPRTEHWKWWKTEVFTAEGPGCDEARQPVSGNCVFKAESSSREIAAFPISDPAMDGKQVHLALEWFSRFNDPDTRGELRVEQRRSGETIASQHLLLVQASPRTETWHFQRMAWASAEVQHGDTLRVVLRDASGHVNLVDDVKVSLGTIEKP